MGPWAPVRGTGPSSTVTPWASRCARTWSSGVAVTRHGGRRGDRRSGGSRGDREVGLVQSLRGGYLTSALPKHSLIGRAGVSKWVRGGHVRRRRKSTPKPRGGLRQANPVAEAAARQAPATLHSTRGSSGHWVAPKRGGIFGCHQAPG